MLMRAVSESKAITCSCIADSNKRLFLKEIECQTKFFGVERSMNVVHVLRMLTHN